MQDLNQLLKSLLSHKLDFLVIGGFAAVVHGSSHVTKDLIVLEDLKALKKQN